MAGAARSALELAAMLRSAGTIIGARLAYRGLDLKTIVDRG